jgi:hypothetical protein
MIPSTTPIIVEIKKNLMLSQGKFKMKVPM